MNHLVDETPGQVAQASENSSAGPTLWMPVWICVLGVLFGFEISSVLIALNWHFLKRHGLATFVWLFAIFYWGAIDRPLEMVFSSLAGYATATLIAFVAIWLPVIGYPQIKYVRLAGTYARRSWALPVGLGLCWNLVPTLWELRDQRVLSPPPLISPAQVETRERQYTAEELVQIVGPLVLEVETRWKEPYLLFFSQQQGAAGSAVIIRTNASGYFLVTNRHVVEPAAGSSEHRCFLHTQEKIVPADVVAYGRNGLDLALLRVAPSGRMTDFELPVKPLERIIVGQQCVAIGNALGAGTSITSGIVSRIDENGKKRLIRTSAPISPGNSGGGLFSLHGGSLIGITTAGIRTDGAENINLAIPSDYFSGEDSWDYLETTRK